MNTSTCSKIALALLTAFLSLAQALPAHADAAPPQQSPASSIDPGEGFITHVQMMSEEVLLIVDAEEPTSDTKWGQGGGGKVEAFFVMRNQGESEESFDVWFPLGMSSVYDLKEIENLSVWVDGAPAPVSHELKNGPTESKPAPWATWPVTFPPGQDVVLRVTYDVVSIDWDPFFVYHYIQETGSGWWGPIGAGSITFRLPYEANSSNTVFEIHQPEVCVNAGNFTISGADVIWSFSDLEPTPADNVCLTILRPALWQEITAAQDEAAANPNSAEAHLRLARSIVASLPRIGGIFVGIMHIGDSLDNAELALAAYERALELDPTNVEAHVEYLEILPVVNTPDHETMLHADQFHLALEQALRLAPDDARLLSLLSAALQWDIDNEQLLSILERASELGLDEERLIDMVKKAVRTTIDPTGLVSIAERALELDPVGRQLPAIMEQALWTSPNDEFLLSVIQQALWNGNIDDGRLLNVVKQSGTSLDDERLLASVQNAIQWASDVERLLAVIEWTLELYPDNPRLLAHIKQELWNNGYGELADSIIEQALGINPDNARLLALIEQSPALALDDARLFYYLDGAVWALTHDDEQRKERVISIMERALEMGFDAERLAATTRQALVFAPNNERLLQLQMQLAEATVTAVPTFTPAPAPTATFAPSPILPPATPSTAPAITPSAQAHDEPQTSAGGKPWLGIIALVLAPLGMLGIHRARRR